MKIALHGKTFNEGFRSHIQVLIKMLIHKNIQLIAYKPFCDFICGETGMVPPFSATYTSLKDFEGDCDLMVSIGGDGTFLESIPYVIRHDIPVIGINSGRLGFLANISREEISGAFDAIFEGKYELEYRTMIHFLHPSGLFDGLDYALNEITIQKSDTSLITIDAYVNDEFLNTYWTDGLIISTPTGSTAYSLSAGGPVVMPGSGNFIIAPIASHNLTVRPLIIPDEAVISLKVHSRSGRFHVTADNRTITNGSETTFKLARAVCKLKMLRLPDTSFYRTLRKKLMWGEDKRN